MNNRYTIQQLRELSEEQYNTIIEEHSNLYTHAIWSNLRSATTISDTFFSYILKYIKDTMSSNMDMNLIDISTIVEDIAGILVLGSSSNNTYYFLVNSNQFNILRDIRRNYYTRSAIINDYLRENTIILPPLTNEELQHPFIKTIVLPNNSGSTQIDASTSRFSGALWFSAIQSKVILLAGLGGIGSYTCFLLSRMKPTAIYLYDDDKVEYANMSGQLFGKKDISKYKVNAMSEMVNDYSDYNSTFAITEKYTSTSEAADIMICGFDNMVARKIYFNKWSVHCLNKSSEEKEKCLFIDGRLSAEYLQIYCLTGDNLEAIERYSREALFSDEEADATQCSYKQTSYMANMIGSLIVNLFTNFVANEVAQAPIRDLPFLTTYDGSSMLFKVE